MTSQALQDCQGYFYDGEAIRGFFGPWRFLSNFYYHPVELDDEIYPTNEHAYQAAKFKDRNFRKRIQMASTPAAARRLGQSPGKRENWDAIKYAVMLDLNCQKYMNPRLQTMLLQSGNAYLEETNHWGDVYWGVCNGVGQNNLGKILMKIRDACRVTLD
jgi:ribA/ribD-fused uncharacterized protein